MKRLLIAIVGIFGLRALWRRRRHEPPAEPPVDELRQKLADAKAAEPEPAPDAEPQQEPEPEGVDARRANVHEQARKAIDELKDS